MNPSQLFVYGTLRHDQPEHERYCRGVTGWRRARIRGQLWRIPEGYLLLEVPQASVLMEAADDADADEFRRLQLDVPAPADGEWPWIEGEVLSFRNASEAWPPIDAWEGFVTGKSNVYPRCVVPVEILDGGGWSRDLAWAYATLRVPPASVVLG